MPTVTARALISDSLTQIGVLAEGEPLSAAMGQFALSRLNQLIDNWNAAKEAIYCQQFLTFTFIANQQDYTIGPTGADFTVSGRPVSIDGANVILDNVTPAVQNSITMRDWQWWLNLTVKAVTTTFPTDCYYEPNFPNGTLHFWPKPTTAYGLELVTRKVLSELILSDSVIVPPGYQNALMLTLAEDLCPPMGRQPDQMTVLKAREARNRIFINNDFTPRLQTQDAGMPSNGRNRCTFNYRTGLDMNVNH